MLDLEAIKVRFNGRFPELLGMEFTEATPTRVVATMQVTPQHCTGGGRIHGGAVMAFADTLGATGTVLNLPDGHGTTTIESKTNFLAAAPEGCTVTGEATPLHLGSSTMVWQTRITREDGRLVALVTQTQMVLRPQS